MTKSESKDNIKEYTTEIISESSDDIIDEYTNNISCNASSILKDLASDIKDLMSCKKETPGLLNDNIIDFIIVDIVNESEKN